jgi:hypothetical protein
MMEQMHIPREELALYAMQALDRQECVRIDTHLAQCAECRAELAEANGELALLAMSVEAQPLPAGAKQRFMDRVAAAAEAENASAVRQEAVTPMPRPRRSAWALWLPWAAVAALVLVAFALDARVRDLDRQIAEQKNAARAQAEANAQAQRVLDLLNARNAQHVVLTAANVHPVPSARAVYLASQGSLVLEASDLAPLPQNKTYELWIIPANGKAPVPAGLFRPDSRGSASLVLPKLPKGVAAKAFGVTVEKASGSDTPTLPIVLSGAAPPAGE